MTGITINAMFMIGYALGNAVGPQPWKTQYQPRFAATPGHIIAGAHLIPHRNHVPWAVMGVSWACAGILLLAIRWHLAKENARREREQRGQSDEDVYITEESDGTKTNRKVEKVCKPTNVNARKLSIILPCRLS